MKKTVISIVLALALLGAVAIAEDDALKTGTYSGAVTYSTVYNGQDFSMTFEIVLTLNDDGSFTITNFAGDEKGSGTYAKNGDVYTLTYSETKTSDFSVLDNGDIQILTDLYYGSAMIGLEQIGEILLGYTGTDADEVEYTALSEGEYTGEFVYSSAMGDFIYTYTATVGENNEFAYSVTFKTPFDEEGDAPNEGNSKSGTYAVDGSIITFTAEDGSVYTGELTNGGFSIGLVATSMSERVDTVEFTPALGALEAGEYTGEFAYESAMGKFVYTYTATVGENGEFAYSVTYTTPFDEEGDDPNEGNSKTGTYVQDGADITFTDEDGVEYYGTVTSDGFSIGLVATAMSSRVDTIDFIRAAE